MAVKLNSSGGGSVTIDVPSTASNYSLTIPAATGTVQVNSNMPAFSAYLSSNQTVSSGVMTKVQCNSEEFDTSSCYDNATNYRFTPNIAGYYQVSAVLGPYGSSVPTRSIMVLYKNGSYYKRLADFAISSSYANGLGGAALVYLNGSTDYIELYGQVNVATGTAQFEGSGVYATAFMATLVRAA